MHSSEQKLRLIKNKVKEICLKKQQKTFPEIIVISKTFPFDKIIPLLEIGHNHFGENKIQEAEKKWLGARDKYKSLQLHMVGKLQSNKAKNAVKLFDYIHSLDNSKLAEKLNKYQNELNRNVKLFIQVNIANETQKSGIPLNDLKSFYNYCTNDLSLNIIGLMCLPPINSDPDNFFKILKKASNELNLKDLSIGMSNDFEQAISNGSTYLRLGTAIFGERSN